ncbi:hypothetical protein FACS1894201_10330 [Bacteroidia bacterium]|nr:hypothetical protein FACS1894201_10330 [Bacteroidia bacterium]
MFSRFLYVYVNFSNQKIESNIMTIIERGIQKNLISFDEELAKFIEWINENE